MADMMKDVQREEEEVKQEEKQEQMQLAAAQDASTMAHNEETEMLDSDSHNAETIENFGDEADSELVDPPQSEFEQLQLHREREELESSDDEETLAVPIEMSDTFNDEWATLDGDTADPGNDLNNHIDIYEKFVPVDLSNDIAVNDAAAASPDFPYNPDAELFEVPAAVQTMPKFEKLSLMPLMPQEKWIICVVQAIILSVLVFKKTAFIIIARILEWNLCVRERSIIKLLTMFKLKTSIKYSS